MSEDGPNIIQSDDGLAADVRNMIEQTRGQVARVINAGMTSLYWRIGQRIHTEVLHHERAEYGQKIVSTLSRQSVDEFGSGFSAKNLRHMMKFAEAFSEGEIVSTLSRQLGWSQSKENIYLKNVTLALSLAAAGGVAPRRNRSGYCSSPRLASDPEMSDRNHHAICKTVH